eukprot:scaffold124540_cov23-Cyclotella_meneghiniana.AAC.1
MTFTEGDIGLSRRNVGQPPPNVRKACSHQFQKAFDIPSESPRREESKTALSMVWFFMSGECRVAQMVIWAEFDL